MTVTAQGGRPQVEGLRRDGAATAPGTVPEIARPRRPQDDAPTVTIGPAGTEDVRTNERDEAARQLWCQYYAPLAGWCAALLHDTEEAHDIASEAFTRLLARWRTVRDPRGFLYVTATNLVRDRWRREKRDRMLGARLEVLAQRSTPAADVSVRDLLDRLPERMRAPMLLYVYADLSIAEIAAGLHRPAGTIKRNLHDARALLRLDFEVTE